MYSTMHGTRLPNKPRPKVFACSAGRAPAVLFRPARAGAGLPRPRSWPLLDPGGEQVYDLGDARRAQVRPPGSPVDPAQVGLAVELCQRVEERRGGPAGIQRYGDVLGEITA